MLTNSLLYYFFIVYLARSKRPNTPHFVFKRIVRNFEVRVKVHVPLTYGGKCLRILSKAADRILQTALLIQNS